MGTKRRRETGPCTGRGFSAVDPDGYCAKLLAFATRPNDNVAPKLITTIDHTSNLFTVVGHGMVTGNSVVLTGGTAPAGLTLAISYALPLTRANITEYFLIKISNDTFKLATTHYNAMAGTAIDFTDNGSGDSTISVVKLGGGANWYLHDDFSRMAPKTFATTDVNIATNVITLVAHGFSNGHKVTITSTGTVPGNLVSGTAYWVIRLTADTFSLASEEDDAWYGTVRDITSTGTGTHTITTAEHFVVLTDTASPSPNDYNTSPAGCAPKYIKVGYLVSESGIVRTQACYYWDSATHVGCNIWAGMVTNTYDSALFSYQLIGGDEFFFQATLLGATWDFQHIDTFTGFSSKLEAITKVGVVTTSPTGTGTLVEVQLGTGQAANFAVNSYYYLYDFVGHTWANYVKVTARNTGTDTVTLDTVTHAFPVGAVLTPYAHRFYMAGDGANATNMSVDYTGGTAYRYVIPMASGAVEREVIHSFYDSSTYGGCYGQCYAFTGGDEYISVGIPDDMGNYDCVRRVVAELLNFLPTFPPASSASMNRVYGKTNNVVRTRRGTMGWFLNTRTLQGNEYLNYGNGSSTYTDMVMYTESAA